ncbi:MAG: hypothetical protein ACREGA_01975 [Candidatus Saccharimonadales bacterium]
MTRILSEILGVREPAFRLNVRTLERASDNGGVDISLSVEIMNGIRGKIRELGLDAENTTGQELYFALQQRLLADDQRFRQSLGLEPHAASPEILAAVQKFTRKLDVPKTCFAVRASVFKKLLKKSAPKRAMASLGYRSQDSMLKHESPALIYAAALISESSAWRKNFLAQYSKLAPSDFETRPISLFYPRSQRWENLAEEFAAKHHHMSISLKELGAIVFLPVNADVPALALTVTLLLLESINEIRCASTFLKFQQVKPDFGKLVASVATEEPVTAAKLAERPLPWRILQHFFDKEKAINHPELFEPHVQAEDMALAKAEHALAAQMPSLEFWENTSNLAYLDSGQPVSLNMLDVALGAANSLQYHQRVAHHVRGHVWQELLSRYLNQQNLDNVLGQISSDLGQPNLIAEEVY